MDARFMVDMETYKYMHPQAAEKAIDPHAKIMRTIDPRETGQDDPSSSDDFIICLPTTIIAFNMHKKEWGAKQKICNLQTRVCR